MSMDLAGVERRSRLVVSVPPSMASGWLPSRLAGFIAENGLIDIALRGEADPVPFERDLIDIRLSYGRFHYSGYETEDIGTDAVYPICSPDFLSLSAGVVTPDDLPVMALIHTEWGPAAAAFPTWDSWFQTHRPGIDVDIRKGMSANSSRTALELAMNGLGVALGQGIYAADLIATGKLTLVVAQTLQLGQPYCLTMTPRSIRRPMAVAFRNWFVAECRRSIQSTALAVGTDASPNEIA